MLNTITPWPRIRELYSQGSPMYILAEDFGISLSTIKNRSSKENWKGDKKSTKQKYSKVLKKVPADRERKPTEVPYISTIDIEVTEKVYKQLEYNHKLATQLNTARQGCVTPSKQLEIAEGLSIVANTTKTLHGILRLENNQSTDNKAVKHEVDMGEAIELEAILRLEAEDKQ